MSKKTLVLSLIMLMILTSTALAAKPLLKVGGDAAFAPFEFVDEKTNQVAGFDVDIMKAIGEVIGYEVQYLNLAWDGLIPSLLNGNIDVIASGMSITEDRAKQVNFSEPYFVSGLTMMIRKENNTFKTFDDLAGKNISVQISTTGDFKAEEIPGAKVLRYNTSPESLQNVIMYTADACILDLPVAEAYLAKNPNAPLKNLGVLSDDDHFGLAMRKKDTDLLEQINAALEQIKADGTYDELVAKWF